MLKKEYHQPNPDACLPDHCIHDTAAQGARCVWTSGGSKHASKLAQKHACLITAYMTQLLKALAVCPQAFDQSMLDSTATQKYPYLIASHISSLMTAPTMSDELSVSVWQHNNPNNAS